MYKDIIDLEIDIIILDIDKNEKKVEGTYRLAKLHDEGGLSVLQRWAQGPPRPVQLQLLAVPTHHHLARIRHLTEKEKEERHRLLTRGEVGTKCMQMVRRSGWVLQRRGVGTRLNIERPVESLREPRTRSNRKSSKVLGGYPSSLWLSPSSVKKASALSTNPAYPNSKAYRKT